MKFDYENKENDPMGSSRILETENSIKDIQNNDIFQNCNLLKIKF